jgi:hypothetical protein
MVENNNLNNIMEEEKKPPVFEILGKTLDMAENQDGGIDGLSLLGHVIALPNEEFDEIKEVLLSSFEYTFESKAYRSAIEEIVNTYNLQIYILL